MSTVFLESYYMVTDQDSRNFALRDSDGTEQGVFSGRYPRQAARKAARRLPPANNETEAESDPHVLRLREHGTDKVHVFKGWAWKEPASDDDPDWVGDTVTNGNVSKQGVENLED